MRETIKFRLNGKPRSLEVEGDRMLLWVLRTDLELTGTKFGCGESLCGACTVIVDKEAVRSCQLPVREVRGKEVLTIDLRRVRRPTVPAADDTRESEESDREHLRRE